MKTLVPVIVHLTLGAVLAAALFVVRVRTLMKTGKKPEKDDTHAIALILVGISVAVVDAVFVVALTVAYFARIP